MCNQECFMEVFSPPRVAAQVRKVGLSAQYSIDLANGYDLLKFEDRARVLKMIEDYKPVS